VSARALQWKLYKISMRFLMKKVMDGVDLAQFPQWTDGRRVIWTLGNSDRGEQLLRAEIYGGRNTRIVDLISLTQEIPLIASFAKMRTGSVL
jgi:hypothetical protein